SILARQRWPSGGWGVAPSFGAGRLMLCGGAAHVWGPAHGMGINVGIGDAIALAWRLAGGKHRLLVPFGTAPVPQERPPLSVEVAKFVSQGLREEHKVDSDAIPESDAMQERAAGWGALDGLTVGEDYLALHRGVVRNAHDMRESSMDPSPGRRLPIPHTADAP